MLAMLVDFMPVSIYTPYPDHGCLCKSKIVEERYPTKKRQALY